MRSGFIRHATASDWFERPPRTADTGEGFELAKLVVGYAKEIDPQGRGESSPGYVVWLGGERYAYGSNSRSPGTKVPR